MPVADYRRVQMMIPGAEALYSCLRAVMDVSLPTGAEVLIVGAGGGREIEALAPSDKAYRLTGVDPSGDMLSVARDYVASTDATDRTVLVKGTVNDLEHGLRFDAATSMLVMHFFPDDGTKLDYLRAIRRRLRPGAPYVHADVSAADRAMFARLSPVVEAHGGLVGLPPEVAGAPGRHIGQMAFDGPKALVVPERRTLELFEEAGFRPVAPIFRSLWYAAWWAEAV
jgi:tRNA (cmo5U34)-methyltransferase